MNSNRQLQFWRKRYAEVTPLLKTRRVQAYTMIVLSLFTVSFFGMLAVRPTLETITTLQKQIEDRTLVNQKLEQKINALITAQAEYQKIASDIPAIYNMLPQQPNVTSLIIKLEEVAITQNVSLTNLDFSPVTVFGTSDVAQVPVASTAAEPAKDILAAESTIVLPLSFSVTFTGGYQELVNVITQLTRMNRIVTIESADIQSADAAQSSTLIVGATTNAYYFPLE
ncbi:MAG: hypothetical protein UV59_C0019G0009 [Candidatus Gottesmanbacteria bacterium GW2011_GWA1_43_11]|uniref:Uncharacterized protein n=1 Tax=Candidatus Gottesmanbacteria bacterium GW2011_GWA1_43_11 TaxID=1618436 RepID=A0A0G1CG31_9BACT|nr:MAG: hypothetical protein UV59_C0019G0009 [Candidatus Gottesmanbacteria bacterium GW2011_GWA1_43_11]